MKIVSIIGHVGKDVQTRVSKEGREFSVFSVAVNDNSNTPTWFSVVINGKPKVLEFIKRGKQVFVCGDLSVGVYAGNVDLTLHAQKVELLGKAEDNQAEQAQQQVEQTPDCY